MSRQLLLDLLAGLRPAVHQLVVGGRLHKQIGPWRWLSSLLTDEETRALIDGHLAEPVTHPHPVETIALPWPETTVEPVQIRWRYAIGIPLIHLLTCLAFVPWLFVGRASFARYSDSNYSAH